MSQQPQLMLEHRSFPALPLKPKRYKHRRNWRPNSRVSRLEAEIKELEKRAMMYQHLVNAWIKTRRLLVEDKFDDWKGSKSTLLETYQDCYNDEGSWSVATQVKLENFARKISEGTVAGQWVPHDAINMINRFNSPDLMIAVIQRLYQQEIVRYVEELHRYETKIKELNLEFEKRFELWKGQQLEKDVNTTIENLRKDQRILQNWVGNFKVKNEHGVVLLFGRFYEALGFSSVKTINRGFPDCVAIQNGKEYRIELEYKSSNFILHKHDPSKVDMVICWEKDTDLSIPVMELKSFAQRNGYIVKDCEIDQLAIQDYELEHVLKRWEKA